MVHYGTSIYPWNTIVICYIMGYHPITFHLFVNQCLSIKYYFLSQPCETYKDHQWISNNLHVQVVLNQCLNHVSYEGNLYCFVIVLCTQNGWLELTNAVISCLFVFWNVCNFFKNCKELIQKCILTNLIISLWF